MLSQESLADLRPQHIRKVGTRASRALLALVFKCRSDGLVYDIAHVGGLVNKVHVLSARLTDYKDQSLTQTLGKEPLTQAGIGLEGIEAL